MPTFRVTLSTIVEVEAASEEDALRVAQELLEDGEEREGIAHVEQVH